MKTEIQDIYNQLRSSSEVFDATTIKNRLLNTERSKGVLFVFDYYLNSILTKLNKGYSMETYKHYKSSRKRLAEFINTQLKKTDIPVQAIDYRFLDSFDIYIKKDFNNQQNTAWNYHKHLRRVLNLSVSMDYIDKNPYSKFKVGLDETHREILSMEELKRMEDKSIQIERLSVVRDIFILPVTQDFHSQTLPSLTEFIFSMVLTERNGLLLTEQKPIIVAGFQFCRKPGKY